MIIYKQRSADEVYWLVLFEYSLYQISYLTFKFDPKNFHSTQNKNFHSTRNQAKNLADGPKPANPQHTSGVKLIGVMSA